MACKDADRLDYNLRMIVEGLEIYQEGAVQRRDYGAADNDETVLQLRAQLVEHKKGCRICLGQAT